MPTEDMPNEKPLSSKLSTLCCFVLDGLLDFCVLDSDLVELGAFSVPLRNPILGRSAWARIVAMRWIREDPERERQIMDRLDLRYAEFVLDARERSVHELKQLSRDKALNLSPADLPGWLYALSTDPRTGVQGVSAALVVRLQRELHRRWRVSEENGAQGCSRHPLMD